MGTIDDVLKEFKSIFSTIKDKVDNIYDGIDKSKEHLSKLNKFLNDYTRHIVTISKQEGLDLFTDQSSWQEVFTKLNKIEQQRHDKTDAQPKDYGAMSVLAKALFNPSIFENLDSPELSKYSYSDNTVISSNMGYITHDYKQFEVLSGTKLKDFLSHFVNGETPEEIYEKYLKRSMVPGNEYIKRYDKIMKASQKEFGLEQGEEPSMFYGKKFVKKIGDHMFRFGVLYSGDSSEPGLLTRRGGKSIELNYYDIGRDTSSQPLATIKDITATLVKFHSGSETIRVGTNETIHDWISHAINQYAFFNHLIYMNILGASNKNINLFEKILPNISSEQADALYTASATNVSSFMDKTISPILQENSPELLTEAGVHFETTFKSFSEDETFKGTLYFKFNKDGAPNVNLTLKLH